MNESYSPPVPYYRRWLTPLLQAAQRDHPVVVLTGARQVGKSTLLLNADPFRTWRFFTLDDLETRRQAREAPESLWAGAEQLVIDEVQREPELLSAIKLAVDRHPRRLRFALSGSANLLRMKQVSESLAGRAVYFVLDPMTLGEVHRVDPPVWLERALAGEWPTEAVLPAPLPEPAPLLVRGLLPPLLALDDPVAWTRWWDGYTTTYLERDLRQVSQIEALLDFRRLMEFLALRSGQLLNQSEIARDAQLSQPTVHRSLNVLETTHLFERLPAYTASHTTRLLKSPKVFWTDPGLGVFLAGYYQAEAVRAAREYGAFFETLIYHHLRLLTRRLAPPARLYYWRTVACAEVDFVIEHGHRVLALEVKLTDHPGYGDTAGLRRFLADQPQAAGGVLIHGGRDTRRLDQRIVAVPWTSLTG